MARPGEEGPCTIAGAATILLVCLVRSPFGHALRGIRDSETRMLALGYDAWRCKFVAFVLGASFAGVAGCLYAFFNQFVSPDDLNVVRLAEVLLMVMVGGAGSLVGTAVGAALITFLENVISRHTEHWPMVLGLIYIAVTLFARHGLFGFVARRETRSGQ